MSDAVSSSFADLGLAPDVLRAVEASGYAAPTPIQARTIPPLLAGGDVLGQAQTGTGKTAAFALPLLSRLRPTRRGPSLLVLTPTRELAIQVAASIETYGKLLAGLRVLAVYGGASFVPQLHALGRGVDVVVGTPGRVMDHMRRGTLELGELSALVLDEADEMLKMGFLEDVEWILERAPEELQIALFSATMPQEIRRIAGRYLREATHVVIEKTTTAATTIRQRYVACRERGKLDALAHLLEAEETDGVLVFVRTREATAEVAEALAESGHDAAALSGDVPQRARETMVEKLRAGELDLIVATDVAARGLDVSRISHVVNLDLPDDAETYVHRIGRTGRAGRAGEALVLVTPRERGRLARLEQATGQHLAPFVFPSRDELRDRRISKLQDNLGRVLEDDEGLDELEGVVRGFIATQGVSPERLAAALVRELRGGESLTPDYAPPVVPRLDAPRREHRARPERGPRLPRGPMPEMERYRVEVGRRDGVLARHLIGAIAGESGLRGADIGRVEIRDDHSLVELPPGMPKQIFRILSRTWVQKRQLRLSKVG